MGDRERIVGTAMMALALIVVTVGVTMAVTQPLVLSPNQAPWWGIPIFTLAGGVVASVVGGFFLLRNEEKKAAIEKKAVDEERILKAIVDFMAIADKRVEAISGGRAWTLEQESTLWSCINRIAIIAPNSIRDVVAALGRQYVEISRRTEGKGGALIKSIGAPYYSANITPLRSRLNDEVRDYLGLFREVEQKKAIRKGTD